MQTDSLSDFWRSIVKIPLLTREEEIELSKLIQPLRDIERLQQHGSLTDEQLADQMGLSLPEFRNQVATAQRAKQRMIRANLRLVFKVAHKYKRRTNTLVSLADLVQEGSIGLNRAVEKFDHAKGFKFAGYAIPWIRQRITIGLMNNSRLIRLPKWIWDQPDGVKNNSRVDCSLDQILGDDLAMGDVVARSSDQTEWHLFCESVWEHLDNEPLSDVLKQRYGLGCDEKNLKTIAEESGRNHNTLKKHMQQSFKKMRSERQWQELYEGLSYAG